MSSQSRSTENTSSGTYAGSILRLPNEILCFVFANAAISEPPKGYFNSKSLSKRDRSLGFLRLSEVCSRFQAVLLSMPALWAQVVFRIPEKPGRLALARSGSEKLEICISYSSEWVVGREGGDADSAYRRLITMAIELAPRLSLLDAENLQTSSSLIMKLFLCDFPLLEEIRLLYHFAELEPDVIRSNRIKAPALKRATFAFKADGRSDGDLFWFDEFGSIYAFDFPALQSLNITLDGQDFGDEAMNFGNMTPPDWVDEILHPDWVADLLQKLPNLRELGLSFYVDLGEPIEWDTVFAGRDIQLSHLDSLHLEGGVSANIPLLFKTLDVKGALPARCTISYWNHLDAFHEDRVAGLMAFANAFAQLPQRPSCDGLIMTFGSQEATPMRMGVFSALDDPGQYARPSISRGLPTRSLPEVIEIDMYVYDDHDNNARSRDIFEMFAPALKQHTIKQLIVDDLSLRVWPIMLDVIMFACAGVTELVIARPWISKESSKVECFPLFHLPTVLPALQTVYFAPNDYHSDITMMRLRDQFVTWLECRAAANNRVRCLHILGHWPNVIDERKDFRTWNKDMCARAAMSVDVLIEERKEDPYGPSSTGVVVGTRPSDLDEDNNMAVDDV